MIEIEEKGYRSFVPICRTYAGDFCGKTDGEFLLFNALASVRSGRGTGSKHVYLLKRSRSSIPRLCGTSKSGLKISAAFMKQRKEIGKMISLSMNNSPTGRKKWYLSPFELQAVTYLTETVSAVNFALERLEEWFEAAKDHDKTRAVINHGSLSSRHFLYNDAGSGFSRISKAALVLRKTTCSAFTPECSEAIRKHVRNAWTGFIRITNHSRSVKRKSACFSAIWLIRPPCTKC